MDVTGGGEWARNRRPGEVDTDKTDRRSEECELPDRCAELQDKPTGQKMVDGGEKSRVGSDSKSKAATMGCSGAST